MARYGGEGEAEFYLGVPQYQREQGSGGSQTTTEFKKKKTEEVRLWELGYSAIRHTKQTTLVLVLSTAPTADIIH